MLVHIDSPRNKPLPAELKQQNDELKRKYQIRGFPTILFIDANMLLRPGGLERSISLAKKLRTDLLTIFPALTARSRIERLMIPWHVSQRGHAR